jgi:hypothetical protein
VEYISAHNNNDEADSMIFEFSTKMDVEITSSIDFKYDYKLTFMNTEAGTYRHHMIGSLENELTSWLDLDFTLIWDYITHPQETDAGETPQQSDFQFLIGLGVEF